MPENTIPILEMDGRLLRALFVAGAQRVMAHQKRLNDINVFPVADADTGTNLSATLRSLEAAETRANDVRLAALALADAALTGARGNSGIVFAQFLYGFGNESGSQGTIDAEEFSAGMKRAVAYAYDALAHPVEGTILTVMKAWAEGLGIQGGAPGDFIRRLTEACRRAEESLAGTTAQLPHLSRAGVVDAGAQGFVYFVEGMRDYLIQGADSEDAPEPEETTRASRLEEMPHGEHAFRFCTEAILSGNQLDRAEISRQIESLGDSMAMAGSPGKFHLHLHTDDPAEVIARLHRLGTITFQKVDDMELQQRVRMAPVSDIALLTDSGCDLPQQAIERHQIHVVPFTIHFGAEFYLDRLTLMPLEFYARQKISPVRPSTSMPSLREFQDRYESLVSQYRSVIAVHFSEHLSGTYAVSAKAAQEVAARTGKRIDVVNSASLSAGEGLLVHRVAQAIAAGASHAEIMGQMPDWKSKIILRVGFESLRYIVKSGRVHPLKGFIGRVLDLKPGIAITAEGKTEVFATAFTEKGIMNKVMRNLKRKVGGRPVWEYALTHARDPGLVAVYAERMEQLTGRKPLFVECSTPGIIANTGPGICISVMLE